MSNAPVIEFVCLEVSLSRRRSFISERHWNCFVQPDQEIFPVELNIPRVLHLQKKGSIKFFCLAKQPFGNEIVAPRLGVVVWLFHPVRKKTMNCYNSLLTTFLWWMTLLNRIQTYDCTPFLTPFCQFSPKFCSTLHNKSKASTAWLWEAFGRLLKHCLCTN